MVPQVPITKHANVTPLYYSVNNYTVLSNHALNPRHDSGRLITVSLLIPRQAPSHSCAASHARPNSAKPLPSDHPFFKPPTSSQADRTRGYLRFASLDTVFADLLIIVFIVPGKTRFQDGFLYHVWNAWYVSPPDMSLYQATTPGYGYR